MLIDFRGSAVGVVFAVKTVCDLYVVEGLAFGLPEAFGVRAGFGEARGRAGLADFEVVGREWIGGGKGSYGDRSVVNWGYERGMIAMRGGGKTDLVLSGWRDRA